MTEIIENLHLRNKHYVFRDRIDAGEKVAGMLKKLKLFNPIVLAIPAGGVPVGVTIAKKLGMDFDLAIVRKILIPWNTEAGYGAVAWDGTVLLNEPLIRMLGLTEEDVRNGVKTTVEIVKRRVKLLRGDKPLKISGRDVILVDDGLASGFTMLATVKAVKKLRPKRIIVAVPTSSMTALKLLENEVDIIVVANLRDEPIYAVADAYMEWRDISEEEALKMLATLRKKEKKRS